MSRALVVLGTLLLICDQALASPRPPLGTTTFRPTFGSTSFSAISSGLGSTTLGGIRTSGSSFTSTNPIRTTTSSLTSSPVITTNGISRTPFTTSMTSSPQLTTTTSTIRLPANTISTAATTSGAVPTPAPAVKPVFASSGSSSLASFIASRDDEQDEKVALPATSGKVNQYINFYSSKDSDGRLVGKVSYEIEPESKEFECKDNKKKCKTKKNKDGKGAKELFNSNILRQFNLIMNREDLARLQADPAAESYVPCSIQTDYQTSFQRLYEGAGCRFKGSVGSLRVCLNPMTGKFQRDLCRKLSWKVNSDKYLPEGVKQEIFGQDKINFNGLAVDYSLMTERLSYYLMEIAGIAAPKATHAKIFVNGVYDGVYSLVEAPDDEMTERLFKYDENKGEGALYKDALLRVDDEDYFEKHHESGKKGNLLAPA